ncbi:MAG: nucleoside monophosphate kinase [Bacilli bacterium]|nr:nucleoside monophosphate kinase [Bacilli bacterium]
MNCIVLIAAPAAGKGTISKYISDNYNFDHISTGDLLREEVSLKTETGLKIEKLLSKGELVSDEIVYKVLERKLSSIDKDFILDGIPRNLSQAENLDGILSKYDIKISKKIFIDIDKEIAMSRMIERSKKEGREDDNISAYNNRYKVFEENILPLLNYYTDFNKIDNNGTLDQLYKQIDELFKGDEKNGDL